MKKILVPTDLSDIAELGLKLAIEIAKRCEATISLVNFVRHPFGATFSATGDVNAKVDPEEDFYTIEYLKNVKETMDTLVEKYRTPGVGMETAVIDSKFKDGIDEYLRTENIDLLVMGTSGEETGKELFTGNHTEQAIRVSTCPVLSVRDGFNVRDFDNIVVAANVITDVQLADGLNHIRTIAECFNSKIHLVHVRDSASDSTLILNEYFNQIARIANIENYEIHVLEGADPAEGVINFANQVGAGLVAVIKNSKDGIFRIFSNRFSNRMVKEEGRPVITVNLQNVNS